jgi:hypothetical protein
MNFRETIQRKGAARRSRNQSGTARLACLSAGGKGGKGEKGTPIRSFGKSSQRATKSGDSTAKAQRRKAEQNRRDCEFSLAPGFSPVLAMETDQSRFNGLADSRRARCVKKTVETVFGFCSCANTRLKLGVNESSLRCVSAPWRLCVKL